VAILCGLQGANDAEMEKTGNLTMVCTTVMGGCSPLMMVSVIHEFTIEKFSKGGRKWAQEKVKKRTRKEKVLGE